MILGLLLLFSVLFILSHLGMSHYPLRGRLVDKLGERLFQIVYSIISFITLGGAGWIFWSERNLGPELWSLPILPYPFIYLLMLSSFFFIIFSLRNPSPAGFGSNAKEPRGVLRITRHPMNIGIAFFCLAHMMANGYVGDLIFFGSIFFVALVGSYHQDHRKLREKGKSFLIFREQTSIIPFVSAIKGKNKIHMNEFGLPSLISVIAIYLAIFFLHEFFFGVRPF